MDPNLDPNTPILVGQGQVLQRADDPRAADEPIALMRRALERAGEDAEAPQLLAQAQRIAVAQGVWEYSDPAALLRERLGCARAETVLGPVCGTVVQALVDDACKGIAAGEIEVALVAGGEAEHSNRRARTAGGEPTRTPQTGVQPDRTLPIAPPVPLLHELQRGLAQPAPIYALFAQALAHARGETLEAHRRAAAALWSRMSAVAAANPNAWVRDRLSADAIAEVREDNRMVALPYTKLLCANMVVDQAAGLILCSVAAARGAGVPTSKWVFPWRAAHVDAPRPVSYRPHFHTDDAVALCARTALEACDLGWDDLAALDLYSCFPSAVQIAAAALGLAETRPLTVTGGLTFAGGPFNSYVLHATATLVERLRSEPGAHGLVTSVGGYLNKHAAAIYASAPPSRPFASQDLTKRASALPARALRERHEGDATLEGSAPIHVAGRLRRAVAACLTPDGARTWATSEDPDTLAALATGTCTGTRVRVGPDASLSLKG